MTKWRSPGATVQGWLAQANITAGSQAKPSSQLG